AAHVPHARVRGRGRLAPSGVRGAAVRGLPGGGRGGGRRLEPSTPGRAGGCAPLRPDRHARGGGGLRAADTGGVRPAMAARRGVEAEAGPGAHRGSLGGGVDPSKRGIVAWSSALTPRRVSTFATLCTSSFASSQRDQLSTYQTSQANFSSQVSALRPFASTGPAIPGGRSWRRSCSAE